MLNSAITGYARRTAQTVRRLQEDWRLYPNPALPDLGSRVEGYFDPVSQVVVLASLEKEDIVAANSDPGSDARRRFHSLAAHEITHWVDQVTTLWGRRRLVEMFDGVEAARLNSEDEMWRAVHVLQSAKRDHLAAYYTTALRGKADAQADRPWKAQLSCGFEFGADGRTREDRPVLFTQFHGFRGPQVSRVPFSTAALLEANATWAEIEAEILWASTLDDARRPVDFGLISTRLLDRIYTPELGAYSVAAHYVSNKLGVKDVAIAYRLASALGTVCLNLPTAAVAELAPPAGLKGFGDRVDKLREIRDLGLAFLSLTASAPTPEVTDPMDEQAVAAWVDGTVRAAGLGTLATLEASFADEFARPPRTALPNPRRGRLEALLQAGLDNLPLRGLYGRRSPTLPGLIRYGFTAPPLVLGDDGVISWPTEAPAIIEAEGLPSVRPFSETPETIEEAIETAARFSSRMHTFMDACRP